MHGLQKTLKHFAILQSLLTKYLLKESHAISQKFLHYRAPYQCLY
jgi:hypothetical protein